MDLPAAIDSDDVLARPTRAPLTELRRPAGTAERTERLHLRDVLDPTLRLAGVEPRDPGAGGCRIELVAADVEPE